MKPFALHRIVPSRADLLPLVATLASGAALVAVSLSAVRLLTVPDASAPAAVAVPAPIDVTASAQLFGAKLDDNRDTIQLLGVLAFDARRAAAIVSVGGEAARVVSLGAAIGEAAQLAEVRARSIVVDRRGLQREIALPATEKANAFVR
ncbi:TPA: general secretion pathway protein GspC [Burkholderia cepacia ATCC 25416]|uniref:type II secretion system protein N n=1 Tax=Burkholderia cepacia TaxID=292 RepID=UPI001CF2E30A|nr:type II secretion system protein N [Burkholderia cepacia]HDR9767429.1 general secretion pathway protein GspC [Burkholderia cepacia ATCC 25416]MCA8077257.1 general secretion pathway protein GspC [Burkholderia cepacia]HDR9775172.1 general secretion pathway protein GspC [Burkholderia cepacia ATCC 25416]HDR9784122.1 general secretion pathway protein GspC [Burkholderia cepacia ATCC 25416]HDR9791821.1 general secretion pathway protein GspC [Burkholderia cepacia ATCC 25416]